MEALFEQKLMLGISTAVTVVVLAYIIRRFSRQKMRLPPGPRPWPIVGNLPHMGKIPHKCLSDLSKEYGPLMLLWTGSYPTVVLSSPDMAKEFLKTKGEFFASRPYSLAAEIMSSNRQSLNTSLYGPMFHFLRRCTMEVLSPTRVLQFKDIRREELLGAVSHILEETKDGKPVFIKDKVFQLTNNIITRMLFNKTFYHLGAGTTIQEFQSLIESNIELGLAFFIGNFIPYLARFDPAGLRAKMWNTKAKWDKFLDDIIDQHKVPKETRDKAHVEDFVDVLLSIQKGETGKVLSHEKLRSLLKELIVAGNDTTSTQITWSIMELMRNPEVYNKVQKELETVVGKHRVVEESDLPKLSYLQAVVKESFRLHPVLPLLLPHQSSNVQPMKVAGYDIPAETRLLVNIYAIQRDPSVWKNPLKFDPERFMNSPVEPKGQHFELLPFGSGRRACPGMNVALVIVELTLAQLLHTCNWSLPEGMKPGDLDDIEDYRGFLYPKAIPLHTTPRLPSSVYTNFTS